MTEMVIEKYINLGFLYQNRFPCDLRQVSFQTKIQPAEMLSNVSGQKSVKDKSTLIAAFAIYF